MSLELKLSATETTEAAKSDEKQLDAETVQKLLGKKAEADRDNAVNELTDGIKDEVKAIQDSTKDITEKRKEIKTLFENKFKLQFRRETTQDQKHKEAKVGIISITGKDNEVKSFSFKKEDNVTLTNMFNDILDNMAEKIGNMDKNDNNEFSVAVGAIEEKIENKDKTETKTQTSTTGTEQKEKNFLEKLRDDPDTFFNKLENFWNKGIAWFDKLGKRFGGKKTPTQ